MVTASDKAGDDEDGYKGRTILLKNMKVNNTQRGGGDGATEGVDEEIVIDAEVLSNELNEAITQTWQAPDGGWGWVIVFAASICSVIVDGVTYTFGMFLGELQKAFGAPKSTIALASSIQIGLYLMSGPIVSAMTNRFGCRPVIVVGSVIAGLAFIISSFSPNVYVLILTYGGLGGIGFGMMYLPSIVSVSMYFEKRRAIATGIAMCGSGVGTFILAPVTEILLEEYNWSWTLMILGAIILNGAVVGGLVRPLDMTPPSVNNGRRLAKDIVSQIINKNGAIDFDAASEDSVVAPLQGCRSKEVKRNNGMIDFDLVSEDSLVIVKEDGMKLEVVEEYAGAASNDGAKGNADPDSPDLAPLLEDSTQENTRHNSVSDYRKDRSREVSISEAKPDQKKASRFFSSVPNMNRVTASNSSLHRAIITKSKLSKKEQTNSNPTLDNASKRTRAYTFNASSRDDADFLKQIPQTPPRKRNRAPLGLSFVSLTDVHINKIRDETQLILSRRDIAVIGSQANCGQKFSSKGNSLAMHSILSIADRQEEAEESSSCRCVPASARDTLDEMLNLGIMRDSRYWYILMGNFFCMIGFYVPFVYIPEMAKSLGIEEDKVGYLVSIIGATNTISRVLTGILVNFFHLDVLMVNNVALFLSGVITITVPFCTDFLSLAIASGVFGMTVAAYIALCSILLCELMGVENLTNAFGWVILFRGVACIIGPPIAGALIDASGTFIPAFILGGGFIILGAVSHFFLHLPCADRHRRRT